MVAETRGRHIGAGIRRYLPTFGLTGFGRITRAKLWHGKRSVRHLCSWREIPMPPKTEKQRRLMAGVCHGSIKKPGLTKQAACKVLRHKGSTRKSGRKK